MQGAVILAARERPRAGRKQMATYQAVAQTQSSWSSLVAARERPHAVVGSIWPRTKQ